jgi:RNA polymerase sigma-70 factor, ECF subfamily
VTPTDEDLVAAFQGGDRTAFEDLVGRWERKIQAVIYRVVGGREDARDVAQEVFLKVYRGLGDFKKEARFSSWLYQIALNASRDRLRRRRGRSYVSLDEVGEMVELRSASPARSPLELVEAQDLSRTVGTAVAALPEEQREVIVLKEFQGLTFVEIADVLSVPVSTVKTRLYRGLAELRRRLERQGIRGTAALPAAAP